MTILLFQKTLGTDYRGTAEFIDLLNPSKDPLQLEQIAHCSEHGSSPASRMPGSLTGKWLQKHPQFCFTFLRGPGDHPDEDKEPRQVCLGDGRL
jgi:hypothetical protein